MPRNENEYDGSTLILPENTICSHMHYTSKEYAPPKDPLPTLKVFIITRNGYFCNWAQYQMKWNEMLEKKFNSEG